jgi:hypothetical protein
MSQRLNVVAVLALALPLATPAGWAELKPHTLEAFLNYVAATEARFLTEVDSDDEFLYIDGLTGADRAEAISRLRNGEVLMERLESRAADGSEIKIKDGLIHHWVGTVFIPGTTVGETLALVQDYNRHADIYSPQVEQARIIERSGDTFTIFYRFRKKKVVTAVHNTEHEVNYFRAGPGRAYSMSEATRIREVEHPGEPNESEKPENDNRGFLWGINSYWKFVEEDGGVYVESESVSLTRSAPAVLAFMIRPFITGVPRELLSFTLEATRGQLASAETSDGGFSAAEERPKEEQSSGKTR